MLRLISGDTVYYFHVTGFEDQFNKTVSHVPIPSMPPSATFGLETSNRLRYSVHFQRKQPAQYNDSSLDSREWCNGTWAKRIISLVERWQARTDGYTMDFSGWSEYGDQRVELDPYVLPSNIYMPRHLSERVYIPGMSFTFSSGVSDVLEGQISLAVGGGLTSSRASLVSTGTSGGYTVPVSGSSTQALWGATDGQVNDSEFTVYLRTGGKAYFLQTRIGTAESYLHDWEWKSTRGVDAVESYTIEGGPESPFEKCTMKLSRKKLLAVYPELANENPILAGVTRLTVRGVGAGTYIVSKVKSTGSEYTVTAYCTAEVLRGYTLSQDRSSTPMKLITDILTGVVGLASPSSSTPIQQVYFPSGNIVTNSVELGATVKFKAGTSAWTVLQLCAMAVRSRIFFANDRAYLIDYTRIEYNDTTKGGTKGMYFEGVLDLSSRTPSSPLYSSVVDTPEFDQNCSDTLYNCPVVFYSDQSGNERTAEISSSLPFFTYPVPPHADDGDPALTVSCQGYLDMSLDIYPVCTRSVDLRQYVSPSGSMDDMDLFASAVARYYQSYRGESQGMVVFTLSERGVQNGETFWSPTFPIASATGGFSSDLDEVTVTDVSNVLHSDIYGDAHLPQKMAQTRFVRHYPERTTEYTFGEQVSTDLASTTSQILSSLG